MGQVENKSENGRFKSNYINNSLNIEQQQQKKPGMEEYILYIPFI